MKLSFIVPIYNVESYLRRCIDSLWNQDYKDYEIILVDDGSTDNSGKIADELSGGTIEDVRGKNHPEIRVIHQENRGLSGARNTGIREAKGEYLCFVDSDDYWEENVLGGLMEQIKKDNLDILRFNYRNINEHGEEIALIPNPWGPIEYNESITDGSTFLNTRLGYACYAWQFIVRADIVHNEKFSEGILFEDTDWTPRMLMLSNRISETEKIIYNYMIRNSGITQSRSLTKLTQEINDKIYLISRLKEWYKKYPLDWYGGMISCLTISLLKTASGPLWLQRNKILQRLKVLDIYPICSYHCRIKTKRNIQLININPRVFVWLKHLYA